MATFTGVKKLSLEMIDNQAPLVLASTSTYRRDLLARLQLPFVQQAPDYEEHLDPGISPQDNAKALATGKALSLAAHFPEHIIIGSDQVAHLDERCFGKPGTEERAIAQLSACSGKWLSFSTGLAVLDTRSGKMMQTVDTYEVKFRQLSQSAIEDYITRDQPLDCAGSIKAESLGVALFESTRGEDINTLYGLPLIRLVNVLSALGIHIIEKL